MTVMLSGIVCDNTCLGYSPGDNTPDYLGLFGPAFEDLAGAPFSLSSGAMGTSLTINGHTLNFAANDPHYSISFNNPLLSSFSPGAAIFQATFVNQFGLGVPETEFLCPIPGVPEPATWALMLLGLIAVAIRRHTKWAI